MTYSRLANHAFGRGRIVLVLLSGLVLFLFVHTPSSLTSQSATEYITSVPSQLARQIESFKNLDGQSQRSLLLVNGRGEERFGDLVLRPQDRKERVTLISVFGGSNQATYLPMFFQTVAQNARSVDLLFVNIDQGDGCMDLSYITDPNSVTYASNIQHLCLNEVENDQTYKEFICQGWENGCTPIEQQTVMQHLEKIRKEADGEIFNTFKPWRGLVYKPHIRTSWWAWCDADQLIGNFDHMLPKDIMNNFDIIMTQGSQQGPKALFLPGQLVLFRNNPKMEKMPFRYKALSSIEHIHLLKPGDHARSLDEGEYSDMYLNQLSEVDVLRVPDIMGPEPGFGDRRIVVVDGHILSAYRHVTREDIQLWFNMIHDDQARGYRASNTYNTLTPYGKTIEVEIGRQQEMWCNGDRWNPINACTAWHPSYAMRNFLYRKNGGPWKIRKEAKLNYMHDWMPPSMEAKMFVHFLQAKRDMGNFTMPTMQQSLYERERAGFGPNVPVDGLKVKGAQLAVLELSRDWWATWMMTAGDLESPRGFEHSHIFNDPFHTSDDQYWPYHHHESDIEYPLMEPAPADAYPVVNVAEVVFPGAASRTSVDGAQA